jgi:GntR family transcriptional regulator
MQSHVYRYIAGDIKNKIKSKELKPGAHLPTELDLAELYDTSKSTARKALDILINEGYVYSVPRVGFFINEPVTSEYALFFDAFTSAKTQIDKIEVKQKAIVQSNHKNINIPIFSRPMTEIISVLYSGIIPVACDYKYISASYADELIFEDMTCSDMIKYLSGKLPLFSVTKDLTVKGVSADENIASHLNIENGSAVWRIEETYKDNEETILGLSITFFKAEYLVFQAKSL